MGSVLFIPRCKQMIFRGYWWLGVIALIWIAMQITAVTRLVYNPQAVSIHEGKVSLLRKFPGDRFGLPRPRLSYVETVVPLTEGHYGGHFCVYSDGPVLYDSPSGSKTWDISKWASGCLSDPSGVVWSAAWYWHFGSLKLGPVKFSDKIPGSQAHVQPQSHARGRPGCNYRVSRRGIVHSHQSIYFALVSPDRCFENYDEAQSYAGNLID